MSPGLLEVAVTEIVWLSLTAPLEMPVRLMVCGGLLGPKSKFAIWSSVGGSFNEFTVTWKVLVTILFDAPPSPTETVIMAVPKLFVELTKLNVPVVFGLV